jgi:hypothetical protein
MAESGVHVAQEREGEALGLDVDGVCEEVVSTDSQDCGAALLDLRGGLDQADELRRSNAAQVKAVEDRRHILPPQGRQCDVGP